jgi:hypothetical protein
MQGISVLVSSKVLYVRRSVDVSATTDGSSISVAAISHRCIAKPYAWRGYVHQPPVRKAEITTRGCIQVQVVMRGSPPDFRWGRRYAVFPAHTGEKSARDGGYHLQGQTSQVTGTTNRPAMKRIPGQNAPGRTFSSE